MPSLLYKKILFDDDSTVDEIATGLESKDILDFNAQKKYKEQIKNAVFPGNTSSHHLNTVAGKAVALTEILEFGKAYAKEIIKNAQYLAEKLHENDIMVLGEKNG